MKYKVYNQEGKEAGEMNLPKEIFDVPLKEDLLHQILVSSTSNQRQNSAHTKNRGEVRGGGRKPWRQKGTGRARHGSTRSPIWRGGGITHGPRNEKNYERKIPKKMRRKALFMVLSQKARENLLVVLDELKLNKPKTKIMASMMLKLPAAGKSTLVLYKEGNDIHLAARNIERTGVLAARELNIVDLMNYKFLMMDKEAVKEIEKTFLK